MNEKTKIGILSVSLFSFLMVALFTPAIGSVFGANNTNQYFNISLVISNSAPSIGGVAAASAQPAEATTRSVSILFNITDSNGFSDVDPTQSYANVTFNGTTRESSSCQNYAAWTSGNTRGVNCTIAMYYYDQPSSTWSISVRGQDAAAQTASSNGAASLTYGELYAFTLTKPTISFSSGSPGATGINASNDPQTLNNTGNGEFSIINITGYQLSNGVDTIGAGNFTVNATNDAAGEAIGINQTIANAQLLRNNTQDLYVWVDIPNGISNGTYTTNTTTQWIIEAYN